MDEAKKKILYIAWYFPPLGGVAALRSLKNVKYLARAGFEVQVLSVIPRWIRHPKDKTLLAELPAAVKVHRAFCPDANWLYKALYGLMLHFLVRFLRQRVLIPDHEKLWLPFAKRALRPVLASHPDFRAAVISSGPPSSLELGLVLRSRYSIPFICDFRDEWTNNPERINLDFPAATQSRELRQEARVLAAAAGIVYLTPLMRKNFEKRYPWLAEKPSAVIPNGFDESDFAGLGSTTHKDVFHLVYSGSFYDRRQPDPLWHAILGLIEQGKLDPDRFQVDIHGKNTRSFVLGKFATSPVLEKVVRFYPFQPYRASLSALLESDALLLYIPSGKNTDSVLTGKIFDYLRSGKPILAIAPPSGLAAEIVTKAGTGFVADCSDLAGIAAQLLKLYQLWERGELAKLEPDREYVSQFSRASLARRLAELLAEVTACGKN